MNRILAAIASVTLFVACGGQLPSGTSSESLDSLPTQTQPAATRPSVAHPVVQSSSPSDTPNAPADAGSPTVVPAQAPLALHTAADATSGVWQTDFTISSTYDIYLATDISNANQGHLSLSVDVFMPGNSAYQTYTTAIAVGVPAAAGETQAVKTASGWRVVNQMPVAGTFIDQYSLTGPWTATAYLGTLTANATFNLK